MQSPNLLVKTRQPDFAELRSFRKTIGNAINFRLILKRNQKRIDNCFRTKIEIKNIQLFSNNLLASLLLSQHNLMDYGNVMLSGHNFKFGNKSTICCLDLFDLSEVATTSVIYCNFKNPKSIQLQPQ